VDREAKPEKEPADQEFSNTGRVDQVISGSSEMSKVALYHCDAIEQIPQRLQAIVESLGAERVSGLFQGKKVLLKPNVCIDHPPERGATTHPAVLDATISLAKDLGAVTVIVGDGAAVGVKGRVFERTGIKAVCEKHGVELRDFNREQGRRVQLEGALALGEATIAQTYFEVDTLVNLPVFKTNMLYWISGALKNLKGLLVGMEKHKPHYLGVPRCVADLNRMVRQDMVIMDGLIGMMGEGPAAGKPANARLLIGGFDPVAADAVAARLMGFNPAKIPMIRWAEEAGVGSSQSEVLGDPISSFKLRLEKPTVAKNRLKSALFDLGGRFFFRKMGEASRMVIDVKKCTLCGRCRTMCPFGAIAIADRIVQVDTGKCEFCLCCTEVCKTEAIYLKGPLVQKGSFLRG
jgi:uncharacterized protein (DUF362 family)/Pyruvate/2-oxoacid:ferredoxin oxidoreductase delta subunit